MFSERHSWSKFGDDVQVLRRLPNLQRLDGFLIDAEEREAALAASSQS